MIDICLPYGSNIALDVFRIANQDHTVEHETYSYDELEFQLLVEQEVENQTSEYAVGGEQGCDESLIDASHLSIHEG